MHGYHIAETILKKIKILNEGENINSRFRYRVLVGESLAVPEEELRDGFSAAAKGTPYEEVELIIETVPISAECAKCKSPFSPKEFVLACPNCGSADIQVSSGDKVEVFFAPRDFDM